MTDESLLRLARGGDEGAFAELYSRHRDPLFRFTYRMTGRKDTAEDIVHDCFLSLWRGALRFDDTRGSLRMYLFGIARNLALKRLRDREGEQLDEYSEDCSLQPVQFDDVASEELATAVRTAVERLPPLYREVLVLATYENFALAEIASIVGVTPATAKVRLHRARNELRRYLTKRFQPASKIGNYGR